MIKYIISFIFIFGIVHAKPIAYDCKCMDSGTECDGGEKIHLDLNTEISQIQLTDTVGGKPRLIETVRDALYTSNSADELIKFNNTNNKSPFTTFFVKKSMLSNSNSGQILVTEIAENNINYIWNFICKLSKKI